MAFRNKTWSERAKDDKLIADDSAGTRPAVTGLQVVEEAEGKFRTTTLVLDGVTLALTDVASTVAYVGQKVYDFPEGQILFLAAVADLAVEKDAAGVNDDFEGDFGLGTVTASNNATLASTEQDLIPTTAIPEADTGATTAKGASTSTEGAKILDGRTTAKDVFLNFLVDDGDQDVTSTPTNLVVTGSIKLFWVNVGDT